MAENSVRTGGTHRVTGDRSKQWLCVGEVGGVHVIVGEHSQGTRGVGGVPEYVLVHLRANPHSAGAPVERKEEGERVCQESALTVLCRDSQTRGKMVINFSGRLVTEVWHTQNLRFLDTADSEINPLCYIDEQI